MTDDSLRVTAIALAAALLFQVQFLLAREILPWFGGAPAVWSTSLVVFQALLLIGYAWAHTLTRLRSPALQAGLHASVLASAGALLGSRWATWPSPLLPDASRVAAHVDAPVLSIVGVLVSTAGLPFIALAATSPLVQAWRARRHPDSRPYRLYAASNAGSLLGLVSYPIVVEPHLDLATQGWWWSLAFIVAAVLVAAIAPWRERTTPLPSVTSADSPWDSAVLIWLTLAAVPAGLLQATTTVLTQDIAAVPFLWMLPLVVYLATFVVAFERPGWIPPVPTRLFLIALAACWLIRWPPLATAALALGLLACAGLALHGELARRAPAPSRLTKYFLAVAAGGVGGSAIVAFGSPVAFTRIVEFPLVVAAALAALAMAPPARSRTRVLSEALFLASLTLVGATMIEARLVNDQVTHASRNFFGTVRVRDMREPGEVPHRRFIHGTTVHGVQRRDDNERAPTAYFTASSGIGQAFSHLQSRLPSVRVGVLGLGIGTLAAYGRPGDHFTFFEIDPQVAALSSGVRPPFTFLRHSAATVEVIVADGRIALERRASLDLDLLVMDAFSSDAVPVHLVTQEALTTYARHLRGRDSLLAVHVSNRYLSLAGVVVATGAAAGFSAVQIHSDDGPGLTWAANWMLLARDPDALAPFGRILEPDGEPWTDRWSAPWQTLTWRPIRTSVR